MTCGEFFIFIFEATRTPYLQMLQIFIVFYSGYKTKHDGQKLFWEELKFLKINEENKSYLLVSFESVFWLITIRKTMKKKRFCYLKIEFFVIKKCLYWNQSFKTTSTLFALLDASADYNAHFFQTQIYLHELLN